VDDAELVAFLQRVLPRLSLRFRGFRRVRGQVRKRLARRLGALSLPDLEAYERLLAADPQELQRLDEMCRITISRFGRDQGVWKQLRESVLPALCRRARTAGRAQLRALSAGCASGEEPYTLSLLWHLACPDACTSLSLHIDASDANVDLLERARRGCYDRGTLRELPSSWIEEAFEPDNGRMRLRDCYRTRVRFLQQDIRVTLPAGPYDIVLARNLPFTYFDEDLQCRVLSELHARLAPGGALVIGSHEHLPATAGFEPWPGSVAIWSRR